MNTVPVFVGLDYHDNSVQVCVLGVELIGSRKEHAMAGKANLTKAMGQLRRYLRKQGWAYLRDAVVFRGIASDERFRWTWSATELCDGQFLGSRRGAQWTSRRCVGLRPWSTSRG